LTIIIIIIILTPEITQKTAATTKY